MLRLRSLTTLTLLAVTGVVCAGKGLAQTQRRLPAAPSAAAAPGLPGGGAAAPTDPAVSAGPELKPPPAGQLLLVDKDGRPAGECPLKHTGVKAQVTGFVARVSVEQEFENTAGGPVEAVYTFPLPEDAAVDDMTMKIGERVIRGQIKRREEARRIYEAARAVGQSAALLDQERPNIFTQSLANLMPGQKIRIAISYVNMLKYDEGEYEFTFPMVVGPRYTPGGGYTVPGRRGEESPAARVDPVQGANSVVTDAARITPPITPPGTRAGHDISLEVSLDSAFPLREIQSQLHQVELDRKAENRVTVRLRDQKSIPNKDFILRYRVDGDRMQSGLLAQADGKGGYFTLILQPPSAPAQAEIAPKEMVFVIDQTGSQNGWPIEKAKETMRFCIENLNADDTFQLLGFNTQVFPCFGAPVPNTESNVQQALRFLEPIRGSGGTDILKSVDYALRIPSDPTRPRIICYMTDGYVGNDMQIVDYVRKNRGSARMFPFGIGNSVNRFLIDQMASEGRGAPYYVTLNTPGEKAASKFYGRVAKPLLLDVQVEWNGLPVADVYPKQIPDVFSSTPIILKGRYTGPARGELTVRGLLRGKPWSQNVQVDLPAAARAAAKDGDTAALPSLWAREKIADLQAQDWVGQQTGNPNPKVQDAIVGLALDYRLMSQHTSFVAVEERVVNVGGRMRRVDVPVEMPEGVSYEGIFGREQAGLRGAALGLGGGSGGAKGAFFRYAAPTPASLSARVPALQESARQKSPANRSQSGQSSGPVTAGGLARAPEEKKSEAMPASGYSEAVSKSSAGTKRDKDYVGDLGGKRLKDARNSATHSEKLTEPLRGLGDRLKKDGKRGNLTGPGQLEVRAGRVTVQLWVGDLPKDAAKQLKALGFVRAADLVPGRVLLGTIAVDRLEKLAALSFVVRVDTPRFLD